MAAHQPGEMPKSESTQPRCMTTMVTLYCFYLQVIHEGAAVYDEARHDDGGDDELELGGLGAGVAPPFPEQADHDRVELIHPLAWKLNV